MKEIEYFSYRKYFNKKKLEQQPFLCMHIFPTTFYTFQGRANFSTSSRPGWLSFPIILKIARMTSKQRPHQHFELLNFLDHPNNVLFITKGWMIKPKICGPGPTGPWAEYAPAFPTIVNEETFFIFYLFCFLIIYLLYII